MSDEQETPEENKPIPPVEPAKSAPPFETASSQLGGFSGMAPQNLPNATVALVLGILSIPGCCCYGILGLILGIIAIVLSKGDINKFQLSPGVYTTSSLKNAKAAKVCGIIGTILGSIYLIAIIIFIVVFGFAAVSDPNFMREWAESMR
jgi:hypothetical protein